MRLVTGEDIERIGSENGIVNASVRSLRQRGSIMAKIMR